MPGMFGWTAASLVPPHQVAAALNILPTAPTQTQVAAAIPDVSQSTSQILQKILGPNYQQGTNPSNIAGASALFSPNYLAQVQNSTQPTPGANGFTQFGNSFWKMPPAQPTNSQPVSGNGTTNYAPLGQSQTASAWTPNSFSF